MPELARLTLNSDLEFGPNLVVWSEDILSSHVLRALIYSATNNLQILDAKTNFHVKL